MIHDDRAGTGPDNGLVSFFAVVEEYTWLFPFLLLIATIEILG